MGGGRAEIRQGMGGGWEAEERHIPDNPEKPDRCAKPEDRPYMVDTKSMRNDAKSMRNGNPPAELADTGQRGRMSAKPMPEFNSGAINKERAKEGAEKRTTEREKNKEKHARACICQKKVVNLQPILKWSSVCPHKHTHKTHLKNIQKTDIKTQKKNKRYRDGNRGRTETEGLDR